MKKSKKKEPENHNNPLLILNVNIHLYLYKTNLFADCLDQAFDSDEDEVLDIDLSSQQEGVIHTFSSSTRQSTAHSTQRPRFFSNDESRNIEYDLNT